VRTAARLDVRPGGEPVVATGDDDAADRRILVPALGQDGELLHQLGGEGIAGVGAVEARQADRAALFREDDVHGTSAFTPVTARPMISFWICDVPS
jgi:hypothetical protein